MLIGMLAAALTTGSALAAPTENGAKTTEGKEIKLPSGIVLKNARPHVRRPSGGFLFKKFEGPVVAVRNRQSVYSADEVAAAADKALRSFYLPVVVIDENAKDAPAVATEVVLVDKLDDNTTVLVAPEQHRVRLATGWLLADKPDAKRKTARLGTELVRAVAMSFGCGISSFLPDVMVGVPDAAALDRLDKAPIGPATSNAIEGEAGRLGVKKVVFASYRKACQEGWAPAPTNDVQRTIWDEVHEIPSEPIKIEKK